MRPYSQDLRDRAVAAYEAGEGSEAAVAARFGIHKSTLEKWLYRKRDTGSCAALPHTRGPARTLQTCDDFIHSEEKKQPDVSLAELCERVAAATGAARAGLAQPAGTRREMTGTIYTHFPKSVSRTH